MKIARKFICFLLIFLSACTTPAVMLSSIPTTTAAPQAQPIISIPTQDPMSLSTPTVLVFPTPIPAAETQISPPEATYVEMQNRTSVLTPTPIPISPRLPAEKWQQWPVIPKLTARTYAIYRQGLAQGIAPHSFAKVGDCQFVNAAFFGIYDKPGGYAFPQDYEYLQQTVDWFFGFFNRESQAVRSGFNVASVLTPLQADPKICLTGETPIACEFRLIRPGIALISMETGFEGRTAAVYEKYMRRIIEYSISQGAVPILATKADNFEGDHSINLTTANLAVEYDIPLWNFWRAVQPLPDHGMDISRPDNFHISVEAWNVRSFTGLQVLDAIWRRVFKSR
ncbi:MAG: hypothetical protein M1281_04360 [Chloroflexi bacterium]|nr:hypothetical protein [Chloroflexota bacterium]